MHQNVKRRKKQSRSRGVVVLVSLLCILLAVLIAAGAALVWWNRPKSYNDYLQMAAQYAQEKNYDAAIQSCWIAINQDQTAEHAYISLAEIYMELDEADEAMAVYTMGYQRAGTENLRQRIEQTNEFLLQSGADTQSSIKAENAVVLNDSLLTGLAVNNYTACQTQYGAAQTDTTQSGTCLVRYAGLDAVFYYVGAALDAASRLPLDGALPSEIRLGDLSLLFGGQEGEIAYDILETLDLEELTLTTEPEIEQTVVRFLAYGCQVEVACDENGTISSMDAWNKLCPLNAGETVEETEGSYALSGNIVNAVTGDSVYGAEVIIYTSEDTVTPVAEYLTGSEGSYSFEGLKSGDYMVSIAAEGFTEEQFAVTVFNWCDITSQDFTISPNLSVGEIRIVLSWGATPSDLDSFLEGTSSRGSTVDVNYRNRSASEGDTMIAQLDVDETTGYGPETTTIYDTGGSYRFYVNDFHNTGTMSISGAVVKIYVGDQSPIEVDVPSDASNLWNVCEIENGQVTVTNTVG